MARSWHGLPLSLVVIGLAGPPLLAPMRADAQVVSEPQLRVLLQEGPTITVAALDGAGLRVRDHQGRVLRELTVATPLQLREQGGWVELRLVTEGGAAAGVRVGDSASGAAAGFGIAPAPASAPVAGQVPPAAASAVLAGPELWIEPLQAGPESGLALNQRRYRGRLQVLPLGSGLQVINHVPLETYLASVVGSEMPASWPQQALRAQAVAARTYALKGRKPAAAFDLKATVASQVYRGIDAETPSTREAVAATRGLVLTYGSGLIDAVFHSSSSGGSTESSGDLWAQQLPYLVSVPDFDQESPVAQWRQPLPAELLARAFAEIGGVRNIEVVSTTPTGRIRQVRVLGSSGQLLLSGAALRSRLGLKSTWVRFALEVPTPPAGSATAAVSDLGARERATATVALPMPPPPLPAFSLPAPGFDTAAQPTPIPLPQWVAIGRGFGHGIGMSQWGALAMARRGDSFGVILSHYYRGSQLRSYGDLAAAGGTGPGSWGAQASDGDAQVVASGLRSKP